MQLVRYEQARNALAECHRVDEVKDIRDKAEAMAAYARQAKDQELILWATEIKVRAERKAGELLAQLPRGGKFLGRDDEGAFRKTAGAKTETIEQLGVSKDQSSRWQSLASMTDEHFETAVATAKDTAGQVTTAFMLREASKTRKRPKISKAAKGRLDALEASKASVLVGHVRMILACLRDKESLTEPERQALGHLRTEIDSALGVYQTHED